MGTGYPPLPALDADRGGHDILLRQTYETDFQADRVPAVTPSCRACVVPRQGNFEACPLFPLPRKEVAQAMSTENL